MSSFEKSQKKKKKKKRTTAKKAMTMTKRTTTATRSERARPAFFARRSHQRLRPTRCHHQPEWQGKPEALKSASWPPAPHGLASRDSLAGLFDPHPSPIFPMRPELPIHLRQSCPPC